MKWELADLVGSREIARLYQVVPATVSNWRTRYDDFPEPLVHISGSPAFSRRQVQAWMREMIQSGRWRKRRANPNMARQ